MGIKTATIHELEWVNQQYEQIGFVPSHLENETIAIVTFKGAFAGVGRIVYLNDNEAEIGGIYILNEFRGQSLASELVDHLVKEAKRRHFKEVYCLPFEELKPFYMKFGFKEIDDNSKQINHDMLKKLQWCSENYEKNVLLLKFKSSQ
ncbi:GNAT family N-acetyltransferase [Bacillaceae bacterium SIJ1]|uniref:GNAT family N-acetyltransferase n=1 Tax=Litoribacterium kuwaitense TaxID=1398745 RepID=UPI0013EB34AD|nr:GNAT family N-acetyltransferase [Litoribacterium kuwaitense]NGP44869.1 GNAT family N-acetyltransferase [Litoribacterium kuwaitense]